MWFVQSTAQPLIFSTQTNDVRAKATPECPLSSWRCIARDSRRRAEGGAHTVQLACSTLTAASSLTAASPCQAVLHADGPCRFPWDFLIQLGFLLCMRTFSIDCSFHQSVKSATAAVALLTQVPLTRQYWPIKTSRSSGRRELF